MSKSDAQEAVYHSVLCVLISKNTCTYCWDWPLCQVCLWMEWVCTWDMWAWLEHSPCVQSWCHLHSPSSSVPQLWRSFCWLGNRASCFLSYSRFMWAWKYFFMNRERVDDALPMWKQNTGGEKPQGQLQSSFLHLFLL